MIFTFYYHRLSGLLNSTVAPPLNECLIFWVELMVCWCDAKKMFIKPLVPVFFWTPQVPSIIFTLEKKDKIKGIQPSAFLSYFWVGITILLVVIDLSTRVGFWFHWVGQKIDNCVFLKLAYWFLTEFYNTCLSRFMSSTDFS